MVLQKSRRTSMSFTVGALWTVGCCFRAVAVFSSPTEGERPERSVSLNADTNLYEPIVLKLKSADSLPSIAEKIVHVNRGAANVVPQMGCCFWLNYIRLPEEFNVEWIDEARFEAS